jgi:uncharacterized paraquat-inducible protein A
MSLRVIDTSLRGRVNRPVAASDSLPTKVCFNCSVQSVTAGDRCPACGARYGRRRRTLLWIVLGAIVFVILITYLASQTLEGGSASSIQLSSRQ